MVNLFDLSLTHRRSGPRYERSPRSLRESADLQEHGSGLPAEGCGG